MCPTEPDLVPELGVSDIEQSLQFWVDLIGFRIKYARPAERFAYIALGSAHLMLDQLAEGKSWITGSLEPPLGRGLNLEITVDDLEPALARLQASQWPMFLPLEQQWYRADDTELGVRQFAVQDPDGYLVRLSQPLGQRPVQAP